jgi:hypothetical protein
MSIGELLCGRGTYALDCYVLQTQSRRARVVRRNLCCLFAVVPEMMTDILPLYGDNAGIILLIPAVKYTIVVFVDDHGEYPSEPRASDKFCVAREMWWGQRPPPLSRSMELL